MTDTDQTPSTSSTDVKETAKEQAQNVAATTKDEATNVVETAKEQVQAVTADLRDQTRQLTDEARNQLTDHAFAQRDNAVDSLRSIGDELTGMSDKAEGPGLGAQLTREAGDLAHRTADFLQEREPGQLLEELRDLGRRRPGTFLLGAAFAGLLAGRVTRGAKSAHASDSEGSPTASVSTTEGDLGVAYGLPTAPRVPAVDADSWGPASPVYPDSTTVDVQPGGVR